MVVVLISNTIRLMQRRQFASICLLAGLLSMQLLGCGDGSGSSNTSSSPSGSPVADTLRAMEATGELPVLDRTGTLTGIDADTNGVRDDMDVYIAGLSDTAPQKGALVQMARAINRTMTVEVTNDTSLSVAAADLRDAVNCIWSRYDPTAANTKVGDMRKLMVNTRLRYDAYGRYNQARNGAVVDLPAGDTCR